jgi:hypothetical protein
MKLITDSEFYDKISITKTLPIDSAFFGWKSLSKPPISDELVISLAKSLVLASEAAVSRGSTISVVDVEGLIGSIEDSIEPVEQCGEHDPIGLLLRVGTGKGYDVEISRSSDGLWCYGWVIQGRMRGEAASVALSQGVS